MVAPFVKFDGVTTNDVIDPITLVVAVKSLLNSIMLLLESAV